MRNIAVLACLLVAASCAARSNSGSDASPRRYDLYLDDAPAVGERLPDVRAPYATRDADNTRTNVRDSDASSPTPFDQGNSDFDVKRTADIRKRIMDADLSVNAQNVKIITRNGRVTLRGPVKSLAEKELIARTASEIAGAQNVDDQLEVEIGR